MNTPPTERDIEEALPRSRRREALTQYGVILGVFILFTWGDPAAYWTAFTSWFTTRYPTPDELIWDVAWWVLVLFGAIALLVGYWDWQDDRTRRQSQRDH